MTKQVKQAAKKPVAKSKTKKVEKVQIIKPTNDLNKFPHITFPYRLEHTELKGKKVCWFSHESHVHKYIERHKLTQNEYIAESYGDF